MDFDLTGRDDQRQALFGANLQALLDRLLDVDFRLLGALALVLTDPVRLGRRFVERPVQARGSRFLL